MNVCFLPFLWIGTLSAFFHSDGKQPLPTHCLKIMVNGLRVAGPQIFNIRMLILSCPRTLPERTFWIILAVSSWEKVTEDKRLIVNYWICVGRVLALVIREHRYEKNELKSSTFSKKLVTNLFLRNSGGMRGIFILFKKHFKKDQYCLEFLWKFLSLFVICS